MDGAERAHEPPGPSASTSSLGGTASFPSPMAPSTGATVPNLTSADVALRLEWEVLGRAAGYDAPTAQELSDLADPRHRKRGEKAQRKRIKRCRQKLEREQEAKLKRAPWTGGCTGG